MKPEVHIVPLTKDLLERYIERIVCLDKFFIEKLEDTYSNIAWGKENFRFDVKGKWELSYIAVLNSSKFGEPVGFWVASLASDEWCHTHRVAIDLEFQRMGIGKALFNEVYNNLKNRGIKKITVEGSKNNLFGIKFYKSLGFNQFEKKDIQNYLLLKNRSAVVFEDFLREDDRTEYCVYFKEVV